jgi:insertion element IS1 protein InsB
MTDHWGAYRSIIPWNMYHKASKAETFTVEGYNSNVRHFLARMRRKTKCYSKSEIMLNYSLKLLMAKWNGTLQLAKWNGTLQSILN